MGGMRMGAPNTNLAYIDTRDAVEGHILAAEKAVTGRFILCNDRAPELRALTQIRHGIDPAIVSAPRLLPDAFAAALPMLEAMNAKLFGIPRIMTPELIASSKGKRWCLSNARAHAELGWVPRVPLETSLADTLTTLRTLRATEPRRGPKVVEPRTAVGGARAKAEGTAG